MVGIRGLYKGLGKQASFLLVLWKDFNYKDIFKYRKSDMGLSQAFCKDSKTAESHRKRDFTQSCVIY